MEKYCPLGYYVYFHVRLSDGLVFYVGKGHKFRAWELYDVSRPNTYWRNTKNKHGIDVFIYKEGMSEDCAYTLERIMISKYRSLGHPLTNHTDGGDGFHGVDEVKRISMMRGRMAKPVTSSLGESFDAISDGARWLCLNGYENARATAISMCARGLRAFAYDRAWAYGYESPPHPETTDCLTQAKNSILRPVERSDGMRFEGAHAAARYMRPNGFPLISSSSISKACKGVLKTAYGYTWKYVNE